MRYGAGHWVLRGEFIAGESAGNPTTGGYMDAYFRLPRYERWTVVSRLSYLKPDDDDPPGRELTFGLRWVPTSDWVLSANYRLNNGDSMYDTSWTDPTGFSRSLEFQAYRIVDF
jgi:hypothetical protein